MKRFTRLFTALMAAICCLFVVMTVRAEAPKGGYRVVGSDKDGAAILEVGVNLSVEVLIKDFGKSYEKVTGEPLTKKIFREANKDVTIAVCHTPHDGPVHHGRNNTMVWEKTCSADPAAQDLWLIAGSTVKIPTEKVETYEERAARLTALDACEDVNCIADHASNPKLKENLKKGSTATPSVAAPVAPAATASADASALTAAKAENTKLAAQVAELTKQIENAKSAPAVLAPSTGSPGNGERFVWIMFLVAVGGVAAFFYLKDRGKQVGFKRLTSAHKDLNDDYEELKRKFDMIEPASQEINLLATKFGINVPQGGTPATVKVPRKLSNEIWERHENLDKAWKDTHHQALEKSATAINRLKDENVRLVAERDALRTQQNEIASRVAGVNERVARMEAELAAKQVELAASKKRIDELNAQAQAYVTIDELKAEYKRLESELKPGRERFIQIRKDLAVKKTHLAVLQQLTKSGERSAELQASIAKLEEEISTLKEQSAAVLENIRAGLERQSVLHNTLTKCPERDAPFLREAMEFRDEVAEHLAKTTAALADAERKVKQADAILEGHRAQIEEFNAEFEEKVQGLQVREAHCVDRERLLDQGGEQLAARKESDKKLAELSARVEGIFDEVGEILKGNDTIVTIAMNRKVSKDEAALSVEEKLTNVIADVAMLKVAYDELNSDPKQQLGRVETVAELPAGPAPDENGEFTTTDAFERIESPDRPSPRTLPQIPRSSDDGTLGDEDPVIEARDSSYLRDRPQPKTLTGIAATLEAISSRSGYERRGPGNGSYDDASHPVARHVVTPEEEAMIQRYDDGLIAQLRHSNENFQRHPLIADWATLNVIREFLTKRMVVFASSVLNMNPIVASVAQEPKMKARLANARFGDIPSLFLMLGLDSALPRNTHRPAAR